MFKDEKKLSEIINQKSYLDNRYTNLEMDVTWFSNTSIDVIEKRLSSSKSTVEALRKDISLLEFRGSGDFHGALSVGVFSKAYHFFKSKDKDGMKKAEAEAESGKAKNYRELEAKKLELCREKFNFVDVELDLEKYKELMGYDFSEVLSTLSKERKVISVEVENLVLEKKKFDSEVGDKISRIEQLEQKKYSENSRLVQAQDFEEQLSVAEDKYRKKIIHERCEKLLGEGSPSKLVVKCKGIIRGVDKTIRDLEKQIDFYNYKNSLEISKVYLDANNMCYSGGEFLGLGPVIKSADFLRKKYDVKVVFDDTIRQRLKVGEAEVISSFPEDVDVFVCPNGKKADGILLSHASECEGSYVVSNDNFRDFEDLPVVKGRRIFKHMIFEGMITIDELELENVVY